MTNRAKRLTGINPLAYLGVEPYTPPNLIIEQRIPTEQDVNGFDLGAIWINSVSNPETIWMLVNLDKGDATWVQIYPVAAGDLTFRTSNGDTHPDNNGIISFIGDTFISTNAVTASNTVSFELTGAVADIYHTDDGNNAIPANHILNVFGGQTGALTGVGININTQSTGNTVKVALNNTIEWPNTTVDGLNGIIYMANNTFAHDFGTNNTFYGSLAGNLILTTASATRNTGIGNSVLTSVTTGAQNVGVGSFSLASVDSLSFNTAVGSSSLRVLAGGGSGLNTALGNSSLAGLATGSQNTTVGYNSGSNYTGAESSNIILGTNAGVLGESNVIRIGGGTGAGAGQQNKAFISGINGSSITATGVVQINASDQVSASNGTNGQVLIGGETGPIWAKLTPGTNITISEGDNSITINATGTGGTGIGTITGNDSVMVGPDGSNNINVVGDNVLTITSGDSLTFTETIKIKDSASDGQVIISGGGEGAAWASLTSTGMTVTITPGVNTINLEAVGGGGGTAAFVTDSGTANESGGSITIAGGSNINTSGAGHTVTVNLDNTVSISGTFTADGDITSTTGSFLGDGLGITGNAIISGTVELSSFGAGVVQSNASGVLASSNGTNGQILIGGGSAPKWNNITAGSGILIDNTAPNNITISATGGGGSFADPFLACQFADYTNVGMGLSRLLDYDMGSLSILTEIYDVGNNFFPGDGGGGEAFFTAPATGFYYFHFQATLTNKSAFTASVSILSEPILSIVTTARSFMTDQYVSTPTTTNGSFIFNAGTQGPGQIGDNFHTWTITALADMTIGDTAVFNVQMLVLGNASLVVVGTNATTKLNTYIMGYRIA